jgi:hypothetical protein
MSESNGLTPQESALTFLARWKVHTNLAVIICIMGATVWADRRVRDFENLLKGVDHHVSEVREQCWPTDCMTEYNHELDPRAIKASYEASHARTELTGSPQKAN